jgi:hypothetical protein
MLKLGSYETKDTEPCVSSDPKTLAQATKQQLKPAPWPVWNEMGFVPTAPVMQKFGPGNQMHPSCLVYKDGSQHFGHGIGLFL